MYPGRTTPDLVKGVIDYDFQNNPDMSPFINASNELVTELCAVVFPGTFERLSSDGFPVYLPAPGGFTYSDNRLQLIETWMAAHYYAVLDPHNIFERAGSVSASYQGKTDMGFKSTFWGQMALRLDTMGALAVMENGQNKYAKIPRAILQGVDIGIKWIGTNCPRGLPFSNIQDLP